MGEGRGHAAWAGGRGPLWAPTRVRSGSPVWRRQRNAKTRHRAHVRTLISHHLVAACGCENLPHPEVSRESRVARRSGSLSQKKSNVKRPVHKIIKLRRHAVMARMGVRVRCVCYAYAYGCSTPAQMHRCRRASSLLFRAMPAAYSMPHLHLPHRPASASMSASTSCFMLVDPRLPAVEEGDEEAPACGRACSSRPAALSTSSRSRRGAWARRP